MKNKLLSLRFFLFTFFFISLLPLKTFSALPENMKQLLQWELYGNSGNKGNLRRSKDVFPLQHYEVPVRLLNKNKSFELNLSADIRNALIFKKNDEEYIRWIINPEDDYYHLKIKRILQKNGLDSKLHQDFTGYLTSSRSMFIEAPNPQNPQKSIIFSGKVSTTWTGGRFRVSKYLDGQQVQDSRVSTQLARGIQKNGNIKFKNLVIMDEPAGYTIDIPEELLTNSDEDKHARSHGLIIRDISLFNKKDFYYLPGFTALHDRIGAELAMKNGSINPKKYWTDNYVIPMAKAMAEFSAHFGLSLSSSHNQQWLVELDKNKKPTGKIVLRDFNDSNALAPFFGNSPSKEDKELLRVFGQDKDYIREHLLIQLGIFHGIDLPSWISSSWIGQSDSKEMGQIFFQHFDQRFHEITKIPLAELQRKKAHIYRPPKYSLKMFKTTKGKKGTDGWNRYLAFAPCFRGADSILYKGEMRDCKDILENLQRLKPDSAVEAACQLEKPHKDGDSGGFGSFFKKVMKKIIE